MEKIALDAYKYQLREKEECHKLHKISCNAIISKCKRHMIIDVGIMLLIDFFFVYFFVDAIPEGILFALRTLIVIPFIALLINAMEYYRHTYMIEKIKIGPLTIREGDNLVTILKEEEMEMQVLKQKIDLIESGMES